MDQWRAALLLRGTAALLALLGSLQGLAARTQPLKRNEVRQAQGLRRSSTTVQPVSHRWLADPPKPPPPPPPLTPPPPPPPPPTGGVPHPHTHLVQAPGAATTGSHGRLLPSSHSCSDSAVLRGANATSSALAHSPTCTFGRALPGTWCPVSIRCGTRRPDCWARPWPVVQQQCIHAAQD